MLSCGITITTRNRREDLRRTCGVISALRPLPDEVIICADGCTDGTVEMIQLEYPEFKLFVNGEAQGSIPSRNKMIRGAESDILISLDDDSYPVEADFISRVQIIFQNNPNLAIAAFPQQSDEYPESLTVTDFGPSHYIASYANAGAAIRKDVFLRLGGYPGEFRHAYEEPDFALRCIAAGYDVRMETGMTIRHHFTPVRRNSCRMHGLHARNELWSVALRCPLPYALPVALFRIIRQFAYGWKNGWNWVIREPIWWLQCLAGLPRCLAGRKPVPWKAYRNWMKLARKPIYDEAKWRLAFER
jgi:GT2 family glycosyltransferase